MEFVDIPEEKILRRQFLKTTFRYLLALSQKVKNVFYFTHLFVNLFVFFACCVASIYAYTPVRTAEISKNIYSFIFPKTLFESNGDD